MPKINVVQAFTLNLPAGQKRFEIGEHEVTKEVAEHWYTQEHVQKPKAEKPAKPDKEPKDPPPPPPEK